MRTGSSRSAEEAALRRRLTVDFPHYAACCLRLRAKTGHSAPLVLNRAQRHVHAAIEAQRERTGKVRALVLKARQQGISTYIAGRHFWLASQQFGRQAFILAHEQAAADALFAMARRFLDGCPAQVRPKVGAVNRTALHFPRLGGGYGLGTAGTEDVGRGKTLQLLHGSEAAFWNNGESHFAGVVQAVPDLAGTEIIIESTANGPQGAFFERWRQAERGEGPYQAIFVPWFWSEEYRAEPGEGFTLDEAEAEYAAALELDHGQMAWRRSKLVELRDPLLFAREYPATAREAFSAAEGDSFISAALVLAARKAVVKGIGPLVMGVDPKREGDDRFAIALRRGRKLIRVMSDPAPVDALQAAGRIKVAIDENEPAKVFIDSGGPGGAISDIIIGWGEPYASRVTPVNFGSGPQQMVRLLPDGSERPGPKNRRAEMWERSRAWLQSPAGVDIPDSDSLQADACAPRYGYDLQQRLVLESKARMASRGARSPDEWDAVALTFAEPVKEEAETPRGYQGEEAWWTVDGAGPYRGEYGWMGR